MKNFIKDSENNKDKVILKVLLLNILVFNPLETKIILAKIKLILNIYNYYYIFY